MFEDTLIESRVRISQGVSQVLLVHQVKPQYPPAARAARVQGQVVLHAVIGKDGAVKQVNVVSGPQLLSCLRRGCCQAVAIQAIRLERSTGGNRYHH